MRVGAYNARMAVSAPRPTNAVEDALEAVRRILLNGLRGTGARVFVFGSRAGGTVHPASDLDVAVLPHAPLPVGLLALLREALDESTVPFAVDLIDLSEADSAFRARVLAEGISWDD